jgi:hypothetical protein
MLIPKMLSHCRMGMLVLVQGAVAFAQLIGPSNVYSARINRAEAVVEKASIHVTIKNASERPITAFSVAFSQLNAAGERVPCGGRGVDMIDWSDPMPGRNLYVHMRRNWIPGGGTAMLDGYPRCPDGLTSLEHIQVELRLVMFEDGSAEGDPAQIEATLRLRRQARVERLKWLPGWWHFVLLPTLQPLPEASTRSWWRPRGLPIFDPDRAATRGVAGPVRDELQQLALDVPQWASHGEPLEKDEMLQWRITDLEQRTQRLTKGCGAVELR